ncbi:membrane dipeptidase [Dyadobacter sp. 3J3]|uniref:membrane dipeptidase n=1 Tax=Dyadobacter sp. 3J3 TaxID=2606600 RepID=UPI00190F3DEF|nr:membrane dipeptidase [Dyadobacter sp. 3J3]
MQYYRPGMLVDLAHCSNDAINDALEVSNKPMIISHTGLKKSISLFVDQALD